MSTPVSVEQSGRVRILTLDDPERRNAITPALVDAMVQAVDEAESDEGVGALVVTGAGRAFCAGADLSHLGVSRRDGLTHIYEAFLRLARSTLPTVAAVNGSAVGAGMNLALACDLRVAAHSARFDTRFLQLGIHPGGGHTWMLDRIVGPQTAAAMVLFGETLDGPAAEQAGLVWRSVADGALLDTAVGLAANAAAGPPELVTRMVDTLRRAHRFDDHNAAVQHELNVQLWSMEQPAFAERLAALAARISQR